MRQHQIGDHPFGDPPIIYRVQNKCRLSAAVRNACTASTSYSGSSISDAPGVW